MEMVYDNLLGEYLDEKGNIVKGVPVVDAENGKSYDKTFVVDEIVGQEFLMQENQKKAIMLQKAIINLKEQLKTLESQQTKVNAEILAQMQQNSVEKIDLDGICITRVKESTRHTIDTKRLKEEMPEIAELYTTETIVGESLRIKIKNKGEE